MVDFISKCLRDLKTFFCREAASHRYPTWKLYTPPHPGSQRGDGMVELAAMAAGGGPFAAQPMVAFVYEVSFVFFGGEFQENFLAASFRYPTW
jgi:hypothetical protein